MATLDEPNAQWGLFHMIVAQTALQRPIHLAQPVDEYPGWRMEPVRDIVAAALIDAGVDVPATPQSDPLRLLPTRLNEVRVPLQSLSHWDPFLPVPQDQMELDIATHAHHHHREALAMAQSAHSWQRMLTAGTSTYGGGAQKNAFLTVEAKSQYHLRLLRNLYTRQAKPKHPLRLQTGPAECSKLPNNATI